MDIRNRRALKETAAQRLSRANYDPRKLALIHIGVSAGAALLITVIDYILANQIENTGGLSGMGMRTVLETVQMSLQYIHTIAMPFWQMGFVFVAMQMFREKQVRPGSLLEGFRRFGSVLRLRLTEGMLYLAAGMLCMYVGSFVFAVTPYAAPMMELLAPVMEEAATVEQMEAAIAQIPMDTLMASAVPFLVIFGVLFLLLGAGMFYCFRAADFIVLDQPKLRALPALVISTRMTKKNRMAWLKLDLSFWWFYLLYALTIAVGYLDLILPALGVSLPVSADAAWFICYILGILGQVALFWYANSYVQTTSAAAYEALLQQPQVQPPQKPIPKNLPWDEYNEQ